MTEPVFVDTNILIYARDRRDPEKRKVARDWLDQLSDRSALRTNLQVLNELTRWILKNERRSDLAEIRNEIDALRLWGDKPLDDDEVELGWVVRHKYGFQWFDCLLFSAAYRAGCRYFISEDMTHGATFDTLTLIDPFRSRPSDILPKH